MCLSEDGPTPYLMSIVSITVCTNCGPDQSSRLAAYTVQDRTERNMTEAELEKYNIDKSLLEAESFHCGQGTNQ
jgi:hypothetical protein